VTGACRPSSVVTDGLSDWSLALAPDWAAQRILIRVSRSGNALTIRAKPPDHDDLQLIPGRQSARQRGSRLVRHDCPSGGDARCWSPDSWVRSGLNRPPRQSSVMVAIVELYAPGAGSMPAVRLATVSRESIGCSSLINKPNSSLAECISESCGQ
jgi:hypothetical protein